MMATNECCIVNYNSGNLASLYNSFLKLAKDREKKN